MNMQVNNTSFSNLPSDLQQVILSQLETPDQFKIRRVCKEWQGNIDAMLHRPANLEKTKKFAATVLMRLHFRASEPLLEAARNLEDKQQSADLLAQVERTKKVLLTQGVDILAQSFSLTDLIEVIKLQKLQAYKNFQSFQNSRTLQSNGDGSEDMGAGQELEIDPSKRQVALQIIDKMFAAMVRAAQEGGIDIDDENDVKESMQLQVEPMCRRFSLEEMQDIRELFDNPVMATAQKIGGLLPILQQMNG